MDINLSYSQIEKSLSNSENKQIEKAVNGLVSALHLYEYFYKNLMSVPLNYLKNSFKLSMLNQWNDLWNVLLNVLFSFNAPFLLSVPLNVLLIFSFKITILHYKH